MNFKCVFFLKLSKSLNSLTTSYYLEWNKEQWIKAEQNVENKLLFSTTVRQMEGKREELWGTLEPSCGLKTDTLHLLH